jgi:hypothetical protein
MTNINPLRRSFRHQNMSSNLSSRHRNKQLTPTAIRENHPLLVTHCVRYPTFQGLFWWKTSYLIDVVEKQERAACLPALAIAFIWSFAPPLCCGSFCKCQPAQLRSWAEHGEAHADF